MPVRITHTLLGRQATEARGAMKTKTGQVWSIMGWGGGVARQTHAGHKLDGGLSSAGALARSARTGGAGGEIRCRRGRGRRRGCRAAGCSRPARRAAAAGSGDDVHGALQPVQLEELLDEEDDEDGEEGRVVEEGRGACDEVAFEGQQWRHLSV